MTKKMQQVKLTSAQNSFLADVRQRLHPEAAKLRLSPEELEVLQDVSFHPLLTVPEMNRKNPLWIQNRSDVVRSLVNNGLLHERSGYLALTHIGGIYLTVAFEIRHQNLSQSRAAAAGAS
jgi:hypothetical protein